MVNRAEATQELFIFSISVYVSLVHSNINFGELYDVKYGFEISKEPVLLKESSDVDNTVLLSSKHGQQYQCILPDLSNLEKEKEENNISSQEEIPLLLEPLKKKCLYNNKGWWTYEVCFGKGIYQYHEDANKIVGDKISLGYFHNETDWSQERIEKTQSKPGKSGSDKKFHSQFYMNGSKCDLTGKARETQIKIFCQEGSADLVFRVDEPSSCSYVITVYTSKLCKHGLFRAGSSQEPQPITCSPALSEERYKIYVEAAELKKRRRAEAKAAKLRVQRARAEQMEYGDEYEIEEDEDDEVLFSRKKKKRSKRSQVWPWENPGVESEDEVLIDGQIKGDHIDVRRVDITKGRKKNADGESVEEGLTFRSSNIQRTIIEKKKGDPEGQGQTSVTESLRGDGGVVEDNKETKKTLMEEQTEEDNRGDSKVVMGKDEPINIAKKTAQTSEEQKDETSDDNDKMIGKEDDLFSQEWEKKMKKSFLKLQATLEDKLRQLGIKPQGDVFRDSNRDAIEESGSTTNKVPENDETSSAETGAPVTTDGQDAVEGAGKDKESPTNAAENSEDILKQMSFLRSVPELAKVLNNNLNMKDVVDSAAEAQAEMEKKFNEQRAEMRKNVEEMRGKMKEIEDAELKSGVKNEHLTEMMNKMKASIDRFEKINMELDDDMQAVKELNAEVISTLSKETKADQLLEVSFRTGKLLKRIIMRRLQLEQEAHNIRKMSEKIAYREDKMVDTDAPNDGIDEVINKLKTMVQALDSGEDKTQATQDTTTASDSSTSTGISEGSDTGVSDPRDTGPGVKVRVSRIKKIVADDVNDNDNDDNDVSDEMAETDLDAEEMGELKLDKRIQQATKKMEEMVKQQLRDSGVVPSGKIKVKIVTSKEALENLDADNKKDVKLLSEKEETQFRDMILNLLGGSLEAGKERRRQQDMESNYNLVWDDDKLQEVPREDDDADGEVEVESF